MYPPATLLEAALFDVNDEFVSIAYPYLAEFDIAAKKMDYEDFAVEVEEYEVLKAEYNTAVVSLQTHYAMIDAGMSSTMPTLPERPVIPTVPAAYDGPVLNDLTFVSGYGEITSFFLKTHIEGTVTKNPFTRKYFGLAGQGLPEDEGLGYDVNFDIEATSGNVKTCSKRYLSINLLAE